MNQEPEIRTENPLGYAPLPTLLRRFAVPSIIAMLVSSLYNIVDQFFIGQGVGYLGNAATNVAYPLTTICLAIALLIGIGSGSPLSPSPGGGKAGCTPPPPSPFCRSCRCRSHGPSRSHRPHGTAAGASCRR